MRLYLSERERKLIFSKDVCRLSTVSRNGWPHVIPVSYVYKRGKFYIPANERTKKIRNLEKNRRATIVIDEEQRERGVMLECTSEIMKDKRSDSLKECIRREKRWQSDRRTVIIQLAPQRKASWFRH